MGSWPPSKPFSDTPSRAFWPLTPLPEVFPLPEPIPRPSRFDFRRAPGLSRSSLRFMSGKLLHLDQVGDLADHPAHRRGVLQFARAPQFVQPQPDQGALLAGLAAKCRRRLGNANFRHWGFPHWLGPPAG